MDLKSQPCLEVSEELLDAIRSFPVQREIEHCGANLILSLFDFYAECPRCGSRIKVRSFSGCGEIEDIFDAVFEWMNRPMAGEVAKRRQEVLESET